MEKQTPEPVPPAPSKRRKIVGWTAVIISTSLASLWAFWGAIENFHEGWFYNSFWQNIAMMLIQYASPMLIFLVLALVSLRLPRLGGVLHIALGIGVALLFRLPAALLFISAPLVLLGLAYIYGRPTPVKWAFRVAIGVPLVLYIGFSIEPAVRVAGRYDDSNREARLVEGNGVRLIWAPEGPAWPRKGVRWAEAQRICSYLKEDGRSLSDSMQNVWRLPTIDEAVRSLTRHGTNAGGLWDAVNGAATYGTMPDKESPLWDTHSMIIYWWTSAEKDSASVYRVVYNGGVHPMPKTMGMGSMAFRAVKRPKE